MTQEAVLVDVHYQELVELHMLVALEWGALAGPAQPLKVDTQTLRQLWGDKGRWRHGSGGDCGRARGLLGPERRAQLTLPSLSCLMKVVLRCSTISPFSVPVASI